MMIRTTTALLTLSILCVSAGFTEAQNVADARLELTFTLTDVTITDSISGNTSSAVFETSTNQVGDVKFEDFGPNGNTFAGGGPNNPTGSIGSASASENILLNGLDPFVDEYTLDSFGIGDSLVSTMDVFASATTPDSVFFGQVASENILYFSVFGTSTDQYSFLFDYTAQLTGTLDSTYLPGVTLVGADGDAVFGHAEDTEAGGSNSFTVTSNYFGFATFNETGLVPVDEMASGSFAVTFDPGDNNLSIRFDTGVVVNAGVNAIPEPNSFGLLLLMAIPLQLARRKRNC